MQVKDLREILEEYDGEMKVVICQNEYLPACDIEKVTIDVKGDNPRLALMLEE